MSETHWFSGAKASILGIVLVGLVGATANAAPILPGGTQFPAVGEPDPTGSLVLVDSLTVPVTADSFTGVLTSKVYKNDASSPYGASAYTFTYQFSNTDSDGTPTSIHRLTVSEFDAYLTDASYQTGGTGLVAPTFITREASGDVMGFAFESFAGGSHINPGQTSTVLVVQTNSLVYAESKAAVIDGSTAMVATFAPVAVPEPTTFSVLALGAGAALLRRRTR